MRTVFLIFSFFFLISAINDCCISELEEELTKITKTQHAEEEHSESEDTCEDCRCSSFCSYNIIASTERQFISDPFSFNQPIVFFVKIAKEKQIPDNIFHPPIS